MQNQIRPLFSVTKDAIRAKAGYSSLSMSKKKTGKRKPKQDLHDGELHLQAQERRDTETIRCPRGKLRMVCERVDNGNSQSEEGLQKEELDQKSPICGEEYTGMSKATTHHPGNGEQSE